MAVHTAAGFIVVGSGLVALALYRQRQRTGRKLPAWSSWPILIGGAITTFSLWQALHAGAHQPGSDPLAGNEYYADEGILLFGSLLTLALAWRAHNAARGRRAQRGSGAIVAPWVALGLGLILSLSLWSLLQANHEAAVNSHVKAIQFGINAYLETLYHIRSGFDASSFVDCDEFRTLVERDAHRLPGIIALEWLPLVLDQDRDWLQQTTSTTLGHPFVISDQDPQGKLLPAPQRERYFPIHYVEPLALNRTLLGYDPGGDADHAYPVDP